MKIFVSIVSHGHQSELDESGLLAALNGLELMVRENKPEACRKISTQCTYFQNLRRNGFGANHNKNFEAAQIADEDWFVICNPDISTNAQNIHELVMYMEDADICTRSARTGIKIRFYGDIRMVHNAARDSRNILSRGFAQHLTSALRYFLKHRGN